MHKKPPHIELAEQYGARNYHPLPVVISYAEGVWVQNSAGKRFMDMLSAYSALNQGHRHPRIIAALKEQADKVTLTSRAFHNETFGECCAKLAAYTGKQKILLMNSGAEAVESAIKAVRRWAYTKKQIPENQAEIIVFEGNFHGRTLTVTSFSSTEVYRSGFGPFTPGFKLVPYGDIEALKAAVNSHTAAVLIEPIQGEAGIRIPPDGYLAAVSSLCAEKQVLLVADEIQTGLGRTGRKFACDWESVVPDIYILGKALGGGVLPVSAIATDADIMDVFDAGSHGSTFGGNPLSCAVAIAALAVTEEEKLAERSLSLGSYFMSKLAVLAHPHISQIRGRGLFLAIELGTPARPYCEKLMQEGLLCKETHEYVIRLAPPLTITSAEIDWAFERIQAIFDDGLSAGE
ncbi:ornithine--oxo-acid transaminase [Paenibacillus sinopodophylli]|uniref:ornithine--oxo-acid transaminase n=1 Tax=Paenibacillus sinopodophylli TaxID=1837342 RepID=UPI00110CF5F5|nr:ornithine--oxo-acid transaminase [Paenibacillus sinopodophylli]